MSRLSRLTTIAATGLTAVALTASMSACSSNSDDAASSSAASDQAVTATADADADTTADADGDATVAGGFTLVELPEYGVSVAVPSDWETLTSANASDIELVGRIAQARGQSEDEVIADLEDRPLTSVDTSADTDLAPYLFVTRVAGNGALPTEEQMRSLAENNAVEVADYQETTSGSGADAIVITMNVSDGDAQYHASNLAVSDGDDAFFIVLITTDSEQQLQQVSDAILASL